MTNWRNIFRNHNIEIPWSETVANGAEAGKLVLETAKIVQENRTLVELAPFIGRISSLLDILNLPHVQLLLPGLSCVPLALKLLQYISDRNRQEPSIQTCVAVIAITAYIDSYCEYIKIYQNSYPNAIDPNRSASETINKRLTELGKNTELSQKEAEDILYCFHDSELAKKINEVLRDRLIEEGVDESLARRLIERVSRNVHRHIKSAFNQADPNYLNQLRERYCVGWEQDLQYLKSLDRYLEDQISPETTLPEQKKRWQVFDEPFTIRDIYVSLQAQPVHDGIAVENHSKNSPQSLDDLAEQYLNNVYFDRTKDVLFIQAGPGRGKTVFCRMFANWVRENLHPIWTPILIRLRDIEKLNQTFEQILQSSISAQFAQNNTWLYDPNTRFIFILDGFDELLMEGRTSKGLDNFLTSLGKYQESCLESRDKQHRFLITGRTLALQDIEQNLPSNLKRYDILPLNRELQDRWLTKWEELQPRSANDFRSFIKNSNIPEAIRGNNTEQTRKIGLAQEPLLLYLLAAMYRDGILETQTFQQEVDVDKSKIIIYDRALEWAVTRKHSGDINVQKLTAIELKDIRRIHQDVGLCIIHSGGEWTSKRMISERLKEDERTSNFLDRAERELGADPLRNALVASHIRPASQDQEGGVEFAHKSFSEFLFADRIMDAFELWSRSGEVGDRPYFIDRNQMHKEIYDIFGFGQLSFEVTDFITGLIKSKISSNSSINQEEEKYRIVFERLESFFLQWCQGKFIEDCDFNIPIQTSKKLKQHLSTLRQVDTPGSRQVDIFTGLNVFILLMKFHQMDIPNVNFNISQIIDRANQSLEFSSLIGYCNIIFPSAFVKIVGKFMSGAQLQNAHLRRVDLEESILVGANLSGADLCRADLTNANLQGAIMEGTYLRGGDLNGVNLSGATLINADLCRAYLLNANLIGANLNGASIKGANLEGANLSQSILQDISWDVATQWFCCRGLHQARKISDELTAHDDFRDAVELSRLLEILDSRPLSIKNLSQEWRKIAEKIRDRRGKSVYAYILNKFAWLSCLYNYNSEKEIKTIVDMSRDAVASKPSSGTYKDTFGVALSIYYDSIGLDKYWENLDQPETVYRNPIQHFRDALNSNDWQHLALPNSKKIRQRREEWIEQLQKGQNPFTPAVLNMLVHEEF